MGIVTNLSNNVIEQTSTRLQIRQNTQSTFYVMGGLLFFVLMLLGGLLHVLPVLTIVGLVLAGFMWWLIPSSLELFADRTSDLLGVKQSGLIGKTRKRQCQLSSITSIEIQWDQSLKVFGILLTLEHQIPFSITQEFPFRSQLEAEKFCKILNGFLQVQSI